MIGSSYYVVQVYLKTLIPFLIPRTEMENDDAKNQLGYIRLVIQPRAHCRVMCVGWIVLCNLLMMLLLRTFG